MRIVLICETKMRIIRICETRMILISDKQTRSILISEMRIIIISDQGGQGGCRQWCITPQNFLA